MANGEIENRDAEELGDLPEELGIERGELDTISARAATGPMFPEMESAQAARSDLKRTGLGAPLLDFTVRSVFDSRPVNARDFNAWFHPAVGGEGIPNEYVCLRKCFQTPPGYVTCVRKVTVMASTQAEFVQVAGFVKLLVDEATVDPPELVTGPVDVNFAEATGIPFNACDSFDTFTLVDEGHWVGVDISMNDTPDDGNVWATLRVGFYGQFLLKTGVPPLFQAANQGGRATSARTVPAGAAVGSQGLTPGVTLKRRRARDPFAGVPHVNDPRFRKR